MSIFETFSDRVKRWLSPTPAPTVPPSAPTAHVPQITTLPPQPPTPGGTPLPHQTLIPLKPLVSNKDRERIFGSFHYRSDPVKGNPERIRILDGWQEKNIIWVPIPQLANIQGAEKRNGILGMPFHRLGAKQLQALWQAWEDAGLLHLVLTFEGSFVPRFVRGSRTTLSNHAFGNAFDINYEWNKLGQNPTHFGAFGSVKALVPLASQHGFYWGGFYQSRADGMHFEVAKLL